LQLYWLILLITFYSPVINGPVTDNSVTQLHVNTCGNDSVFWEL